MAAATNSDGVVKMICGRAINGRVLVQWETRDGQPWHSQWIEEALVQSNQLYLIFNQHERWRPSDGAGAQNDLELENFGDGDMAPPYVASRALFNYGVYYYDVPDLMTAARHGLNANPAYRASMIANRETVKLVSKAVCVFSPACAPTAKQCPTLHGTGRGHNGAVRE